jgi:hypothetical protein
MYGGTVQQQQHIFLKIISYCTVVYNTTIIDYNKTGKMDNEVEPNIEVNPDDDHNDHNDHNVENMIDANEDEVDEDEDDDDSANNDERPRDDNNGALDGGSAEGLTIHSSDCAMVSNFYCV